MGEKSKISIRNIRREANEDLKKKLKEKKISEDENKNFELIIPRIKKIIEIIKAQILMLFSFNMG